ncbi:protein cueball-like [Aphis craccivora]|uniref:Protein cueball-like n=1 Tax=Aphis craccivora TaxID=307492 RepID=A0A6G0Y596_APHCR|nr:protein cueball-like [Aphis craccivora]
MKTVAFEFASILVVIFNEPPECLLVDDLNHKIFWSNSQHGIIKAYDPIKNIITTLVNSLTMPKSMVIDSSVKLLFWCNFEFVGSIERISFNGNNRVKINKGTYDLHYPDTLGIDHKNRMLYWISNKVIHTSDYNGNFHKTVNKSASYNPNIPRCITFTNAAEYNFYWEKKKVPYHERSFAPNDLLSISYQKNAKEEYDAEKLPAGFRVQILQQKNWITSHVCQNIPSGYHCFLPPVPLNRYIKVCQLLSKAGYKSMKLSEISNFSQKHKKLLLKVHSFYFNSKPHNVFYYDAETKNIRFISHLEEHPIDIVKNVSLPINGFTYDGINNTIYYINASENSIMMMTLDNNYYPKNTTVTALNNSGNSSIVASLNIDTIHNRFMLFVDQNKQFSDLRKNKNCSTYIINNLRMALAANIIIMNPINNKLYILKNTAETIEQFDLEETNNERSQNPYVYLYPTEYTLKIFLEIEIRFA